ncbi:MAG TPA: vWA domain-containing protein [Oligoflexus sp.]|uniref:vWA domain-containing protein n=1 Tax=Oligoflexus sp. TaxID=1971216 RepID=UPI002D25B4C1|nr:vWA domain-containing protein [Oligoflexus sp.]HYX35404.1 vWA domain-containing protein [Oligoflexus sp.]
MMNVLEAKICRILLLIPLFHASGCGNKDFQGATPEQQTPILEADVSVAPMQGQEINLPAPVGMEPETIMGLYPAAQILSDKLSFTIDTQDVRTEFELKDIYKEHQEVFRQVGRDSRTEKFQQGHPSQGKQDVFDQQAKKGLVDILVVIDNSISMTEEQRNLSDKMHELVASLGNSDWQIGVINTTAVYENGIPQCLMNLIRSTDTNAAEKFRSAVLAGTSGSSNEEGILQAVVGLSCPSRPWLRSHASVAVLIVSDEDNCSADGADCRGSVAENEQYLIQYVEQKLGLEVGKNAGFYGIFSPPAAPCVTSSNTGIQYQRLVNYKAQGMVNYGNICDASYKTTLNRISDNIAVLLGSRFELKEKPLSGSLKLKLVLNQGTERVIQPNEYTLNEKTIIFAAGQEPPARARLVADYLVPGRPLWKKLSLAEKPGQGTLDVQFNNQPVSDQAYRWDGQTLEFYDFPPAGALVRVSYGLDKPLNRTFSLSSSALGQTLDAEINGQPTQAFSIDGRGMAITFDPAPTYDARISLAWTSREGPQLTYALPVAKESSSFQILDGNRLVPFTENQGLFTIPADLHRPGKKLTLQYQMPDARTRTFALAHQPIPQSAHVEMGANTCQLGAGLELQDGQLISTCGVKSRTEFVVSYQYYEPQMEFTLAGIQNPDAGLWKVLIDGVPTQDYVRKGATFSFPSPMAPESQIGLQYTFPVTLSRSSGL